MTSNRNNMMKDYLNEMQKYMNSSQNLSAGVNDTEDNSHIDGKINSDKTLWDKKISSVVNNNMNNLQNEENIIMNKDKLYEQFMIFINSQQTIKSNMMAGKSRDVNESQDFTQVQHINLKKSLEMSITDLDKSLEKQNISIKVNNNPPQNKDEVRPIIYHNKNNSINIVSYFDEDIKVSDLGGELNVSRSIQNENTIQNTETNNNNFNTYNNEEIPCSINQNDIKSFDDIPIKPKTTNFLELLEQNLAKEENVKDNNDDNGDAVNAEKIRRIREAKSKIKRNNLNVQPPAETKKYKYYLQNFNKNFGKDDKPDDEEVTPVETKPVKNKIEDKKNVKKTNPTLAKKNTIKHDKNIEKEKTLKNQATNASKVTSSLSNYTTVNNESSKNNNNFTSNKRDSATIWSEKNNDDKKVDDFLNTMPKQSQVKGKKLSIKEEKVNLSSLNNNQDYEIKMINKKIISSTNKPNSNNKNNQKLDNSIMKQSYNIDTMDLKAYYQTNTLNDLDILKEKKIDIIIGDNYKTNALKMDNVNLDNLDLYDFKSKKSLQIEVDKITISESKDIDDFKNNDYKDEYLKDITTRQDESQEMNFEEKEDDGDDDRDIIRMYEQKIQNNSAKAPILEKFAEKNKEDINKDKKPEQSKLINKYFKPLMKAESNKTNSNDNITSEIKSSPINQLNQPQSNYQDIVNEKINELNKEIEKLRKENEKVSKLKAEYERLTKKLNREMEEFSAKRQRETEEFEIWKDEEMKKMEKERKVHIRNTKLIQNMPNRKEREEIDILKEQVMKLQEEMKAKDQRNKLANERTKKQLDDSLKKNEELQKEIKFMEEMRVRNMMNTTTVNRNRALSKGGENILNNNIASNNSNNIRMNSLLTNNKSMNNLVSPPPRKIQTQKEKSSFKLSIPQQQPQLQQQKANMTNYSIKAISEYNNNNEVSSSEDNVVEDLNMDDSQISNNDEESSATANKMKDYYKIKHKSSKDEETEIKINKGKVVKTSNNLTKYESRQSSRRQTEENIKSPNLKATLQPNQNTRLESLGDNLKQIKQKDITSVSPPKKQSKKQSNENMLIKSQEDNKENFDMIFLDKYHGKSVQNVKLLKQEFTEDGKIIKLYENMKKVVRFPSGVVKEIFDDGYQVTYFNNKDIKQVYPDKKEVYLFAENKTLQFKFADGLHVFKFEGGLLEKHYPDGTKVVNYVDGRIRNVYPDGYEETFFPDGSLQKIDKNGIVTFDYEDGLKDTIYPDGLKIREFPDGKVIKVFPDGRIENYYK